MAKFARPDVTLFYETHGQGIPVLFLQGIGIAGRGWQRQVEGLGEGFKCLTFDNRGVCQSAPCRGPIRIEDMAEDARALMDHLGWPKAHVVGHSLGGVVAQQLALAHPQRVSSLSLLCTFARGKEGARATPWVVWMSIRTRIGTRHMRRKAFLELMLTPEELAKIDVDQFAEEVAPLIGRDLSESPPIMMRQLRALGRHDTYARLGELAAIPTLVMSSEFDPIAKTRYGRELAAAIPHATYEEMRATSHGVILTQPELVNPRLRQFILAVDF